MHWRMEKRDAFEVFGIERRFGHEETGRVLDFWTACRRNGRYDRLLEAAGEGPSADGCKRLFAVCGCSEPDEDVFPYMICALRKPESRTEGFRIAQIPKASWAVFRSDTCSHMGTEIPSLFSRAYSEWLPASGYDKAPGPDMELYYTTPDGKHFEEVWIPVRKT